jgi:RimJ/RimL family protein N-acetyltransferase
MLLRPATDGVVVIRPPAPGDAARLVAGRDAEFHRWLGPGADVPQPVACIVVDDDVVGWVDYDVDVDHDWLLPGEVNVGYHVFAPHRRKGYASRAVALLLRHLAEETEHHTATLLIDPGNEASLAVAARTRFVASGDLGGQRAFKRPLA